MVLGEDRLVAPPMPEHADTGHFLAGVVPNRRAGAKQPLHRVGLDRRWAEANHLLFRTLELLLSRQTQAAQPARCLPRREIDGAVARHLLAEYGSHRHLVWSKSP